MTRQFAVGAVGLCVLVTTGCRSDNLLLSDRTTMWADTRGVALHDEGELVHAAMMDTTCEFDASTGILTGDWDLPTDSEVVEDGYIGSVLGSSATGLHLVNTTEPERSRDWQASGVVAAKLTDQGAVSLETDSAGCHVQWRGDELVRLQMPDEACAPEAVFTVDRSGGAAFVGTPSETWVATPSGRVDALGSGADTLRWHEPADALVLASGSDVTLMAPDGRVHWTMPMGAQVTSVGVLAGNHVGVLDSNRVLSAIDAFSGLEFASNDNVPRGDLVTSNTGDLIAFVTENTVDVQHVDCGSHKEPEPPPPLNLLD